MVLNFDAKNVISNSNIISYLLEKSRVTKRDPKERHYHVFYQVRPALCLHSRRASRNTQRACIHALP